MKKKLSKNKKDKVKKLSFNELINKFNKNKKYLSKKYKYKFKISKDKNDLLSLGIHYIRKIEKYNFTVFELVFSIDKITNKHKIIEIPIYYGKTPNNQIDRVVGDIKESKFNIKKYEKYFEIFLYLSIKYSWDNL